MTKTPVKFQGNRHKTVGEVTHYLCTFESKKTPPKRLSSTCGKSDKNNLRIISKPHAYLQTMTKRSVKFQKNRHKTVGGVAHIRYLLLFFWGGGGRKDGRTEGRNAENYVPPLFFEKAGAKKILI